jgi:hypothetical protein
MLDAGDDVTTPAPVNSHASGASQQPLIADVFSSFPGDPGTLSAAVQQRVQQLAPLVPVHVHVPGFEDEPRARMRPYRDPAAWLWLKHAVQLALVAAVLMFVVRGGNDPALGLSYVATALLLMGCIAVADRMRFADRDPAMVILEMVAAEPRPRAASQARPLAPLVPLVEQMQVAMPPRVDVT